MKIILQGIYPTLILLTFIFNGCANEQPVPTISKSQQCNLPKLPIYKLPPVFKKDINNINKNDLIKISKNYKILRSICKKYETLNKHINAVYNHKKAINEF